MINVDDEFKIIYLILITSILLNYHIHYYLLLDHNNDNINCRCFLSYLSFNILQVKFTCRHLIDNYYKHLFI